MKEYPALAAYSRGSRITYQVLRHLVARGTLSPALTEADRAFLERLESIWQDRLLLRAQLRKLGKADRLALMATADYDSKWERYVYSRLRNALARGRTVSLADLEEEIRERFGFTPAEFQLRKIRRIRNRIYVQRSRARKAGKVVGDCGGTPHNPGGKIKS